MRGIFFPDCDSKKLVVIKFLRVIGFTRKLSGNKFRTWPSCQGRLGRHARAVWAVIHGGTSWATLPEIATLIPKGIPQATRISQARWISQVL